MRNQQPVLREKQQEISRKAQNTAATARSENHRSASGPRDIRPFLRFLTRKLKKKLRHTPLLPASDSTSSAAAPSWHRRRESKQSNSAWSMRPKTGTTAYLQDSQHAPGRWPTCWPGMHTGRKHLAPAQLDGAAAARSTPCGEPDFHRQRPSALQVAFVLAGR